MSKINSSKDIGLLLLRGVIGLCMIAFHGLPKLIGGPQKWEKIGLSMGNLGINFLPTFWGFAASITETVCALFLIIGLWTRPNALLLAFTLLIASVSHLINGDGLSIASHAIELLTVCVALVLIGPGKYSVDKK